MVLINLDRLYDETLYDFTGCFKQFALNRYMKQNFEQKQYWQMETDSPSGNAEFDRIRHNAGGDYSVADAINQYHIFCREMLFYPKCHQEFYETLIIMARNIEKFAQESYFTRDTCYGIVEGLHRIVGSQYEGKTQLLERCRSAVIASRARPFLVLEGELMQLCVLIGSMGVSNHGEQMFEFRDDGSSRKGHSPPNILFYNAFDGFLITNPDLAQLAIANTGRSEKFRQVSLLDFMRNPLGLRVSFQERKSSVYHFKAPLRTDFKALQPQKELDFGERTEAGKLREHLYLTLYVNQCFIQQPRAIDLRKCMTFKDVSGGFPIITYPQSVGAFWNIETIDFAAALPKRTQRLKGCSLPRNVAEEILGRDQQLFELGVVVPPQVATVAAAAQTAPVNPAPAQTRVSLGPDKKVRFSNKDKVTLVPAEDSSRGGATINLPTKSRPEKEDPETENDNTTLAYIAAALLGFAGLFYYAD